MMSDTTLSRPEVVSGHTDVIYSTSVCHILAVRKSILLQIDTLIRQLAEIVTNGAIVIHTQRLKSDPGGNLLS